MLRIRPLAAGARATDAKNRTAMLTAYTDTLGQWDSGPLQISD